MAKYDVQAALGHAPDHAYIPYNVNQPVIFIAPDELAAGSGEIWAAVSCSDENYGGCVVWASIDAGTSYHKIGKLYGSSNTGLLTSALPISPDTVDVTNSVSVNIYSPSVLASVSAESVNTYHSLCRVGNEFLSYRYANIVGYSGGNASYLLSNLRRGLYGSTSGASSGYRFAFLNDTIFKYRFNQNIVGSYIYFKFQGFNAVEGGFQDISVLPAYSLVVSGTGGVKATRDYVDTSVSTAVSSAVAGIKINMILNSTMTGLTPVKVGAMRLPAGVYGAPHANIGCVNALHAAKIELRSAAGMLLATVGGTAGNVAWRTAGSGFTLAVNTDIDLTISSNNSAGVVNVYGFVL